MRASQLQKLVMTALEDYKAIDIVSLDIKSMTSIADKMVICSGTSKRHVQSMAEHVVQKAKAAGVQPIGVEGAKEGEWVLVDLGDVIVHVMLPQAREFYSLEKLWSTAKALRKSHGD